MHVPGRSPIKAILADIEATTNLKWISDLPRLSERA
jgi:hypothetical protein